METTNHEISIGLSLEVGGGNVTYLKFKVMKIIRILTAIVVLIFANSIVSAQENIATLVVSADGATKDEAIKIALRSAVEQTYGTFVSANTSIFNDELVADEMATISSGNVENYTEITCEQIPSGRFFITLKVTVSISNLTHYAQSKGAETEFAGATFAQNLLMKELNKNNEEKVVSDLLAQMKALLKSGFNYSILTGEPTIKGRNVLVPVTINAEPNSNCYKAIDLFLKTIAEISLTEQEVDEYKSLGIDTFPIIICNSSKKGDSYNVTKLHTFRSKKTFYLIRDFFGFVYFQCCSNFSINTDISSSSLDLYAYKRRAKLRYGYRLSDAAKINDDDYKSYHYTDYDERYGVPDIEAIEGEYYCEYEQYVRVFDKDEILDDRLDYYNICGCDAFYRFKVQSELISMNLCKFNLSIFIGDLCDYVRGDILDFIYGVSINRNPEKINVNTFEITLAIPQNEIMKISKITVTPKIK